jgi:spermidine synthase
MEAERGRRADPVRELIRRYYGEECRILTVRRSGGARSFLFVVEAMYRGRQLRTLGTVGRLHEVMEHSAMDMLAPARLVFPYERLMLMSLAIAETPARALLLGLGGGAMTRHLAAHFPDLDTNVVERDRGVIALAREFFHIDRPITRADGTVVVADEAGQYDIVMVDLYDASGAAPLEPEFWQDCLAALRPGGCLAINWAGGWTGGEMGTAWQRVGRVAPRLERSFFVVERGPRGNIVQFVPASPGFRVAALETRWLAFSLRHALPREDRDILQRCEVRTRFPPLRHAGRISAAPAPQ